MSEDDNPDDLLRDARMHALTAKGHWGAYDDARAGQAALRALRCYQDLDALISIKKVELPEAWRR